MQIYYIASYDIFEALKIFHGATKQGFSLVFVLTIKNAS